MLDNLKPVFESFEKHDVRYIVIGGIAAILHGVPRMTFDLDILIDASSDNAERLLSALNDSGFGTASLIDVVGLMQKEITIFQDYERVDVQIRTPGIDFAHSWINRIRFDLDGVTVNVLNRQDLIASKRAAGRPIDLEDVRLLELDS